MLLGNSKFKIELINDNNKLIIKKSSDLNNKIRLQEQKNKQIGFCYLVNYHPLLHNFFEIPKILNDNTTNKEYYFTMPFYYGDNVIDIIEKNNLFTFNLIIDKLFSFLDFEMSRSQIVTVEWDIIRQKLVQLAENISTKSILVVIEKVLSHYKSFTYLKMPIGLCHGDFTFSNMIFGEKIVLIDFLDSFIESPLQDIAKLLQEVKLQWTLRMMNSSVDKIKVKIAYNYLFKKITLALENFIYKHNLSKHNIKLFYLLTLLRVVPYINNKDLLELLDNEIMLTWEEMS